MRNKDLVRQGLSPYYTKYGRSQKYDREFRAAEKSARKQKLNIWGDPALSQKFEIEIKVGSIISRGQVSLGLVGFEMMIILPMI